MARIKGAVSYPLEEVRELTYGEKLVGLTFNPSGDEKVNRAKVLFAEIADLVNNELGVKTDYTPLSHTLFHHTVGEILNAQMNVVKLLTFKH